MFISHQCAVVAAANRNSFDCPSPMHDKMKRNGMATIQFADPNLTVYVSQADNLKAFCQCLLLHLNGMPTAVVASRHVHLPMCRHRRRQSQQFRLSVANALRQLLDDQTSAKVAAANRNSFNCPSPMHFGKLRLRNRPKFAFNATGISVDDQTRRANKIEHSLDQLQQSLAEAHSRIAQLEQLQNIQATINEDVSLLAAQLQNEKATVSRAVAQNLELKSQLKELQDRLIAVINESAAKEDERNGHGGGGQTKRRGGGGRIASSANLQRLDIVGIGFRAVDIRWFVMRRQRIVSSVAVGLTRLRFLPPSLCVVKFSAPHFNLLDISGNEHAPFITGTAQLSVDNFLTGKTGDAATTSSTVVSVTAPPALCEFAAAAVLNNKKLLCPGSSLLRPSFADCLPTFVGRSMRQWLRRKAIYKNQPRRPICNASTLSGLASVPWTFAA
ncbi:hypothetical protein niasHT_035712 [Heterodera trifolii]|uniref:Golgin subfamily A conserved domain-containing protein n=1 Tax=Heterodera trifolii TaxID=157864 RepID=A0ABD2I4D2_9BILA